LRKTNLSIRPLNLLKEIDMPKASSNFLPFFVCVTILFACGANLNGQSAADRAKADAEQNEALRRAREDELENSRRLVRDFRARVQEASDRLTTLQPQANKFKERLKSLLTDSEGKRLATDPSAFLHYRDLQTKPPVQPEEIAAKKEFVDSLLKELDSELAKTNVGYLPPKRQKDDIEQTIAWARAHSADLGAEESWLDHIIAKAPAQDAKARTLQDVIADYNALLIDLATKARLDTANNAKEDVRHIAADSARTEVLEQARAEADRALKEARAQIAMMQADFEVQLKQLKDADDQHIADLERKLAESNAARAKQNAETASIVRQGQLDADVIQHRQMIRDPKVQNLLAPFLAKGYWQPGDGHDSYGRVVPSSIDPVPMSLKRIRAAGALNRTRDGLAVLYDIGEAKHGPQDREVKWGFGRLEDLTPAEFEQLKLAQKYLIDLGDALVEAKLLEP
jgi:hypothetical protein